MDRSEADRIWRRQVDRHRMGRGTVSARQLAGGWSAFRFRPLCGDLVGL